MLIKSGNLCVFEINNLSNFLSHTHRHTTLDLQF